MPKYFATCPKGFSRVLKSELESLDLKLKNITEKPSGVGFECSWLKAYEVNMRSKVASRILLPVFEFQASTLENIKPSLKKANIEKYIPRAGSFSLRVRTTAHSKFRDQKYVMNEIRVGLLEAFQSQGRTDIRVNTETPTLEIFVTESNTHFLLALNLSGEPLSNRGYRQSNHVAPLRENVAAGLVRYTGWDGKVPLVDFMCGTGTFLVEAATLNNPLDRKFSFMGWQNFSRDEFTKMKSDLPKELLKNIHGFDQAPKSVQLVKKVIKDKKLESSIEVKQIALKDFKNFFTQKGIVILNPPYGERLGSKEEAMETYELVGKKLKEEFSGWKAYILSPTPELTKCLQLRSSSKIIIDNGGMECAFLEFEIK